MRNHPLGIYEKALAKDLSWPERLVLAKSCGFDFVEMSVDETDERLSRLDWSPAQRASLVSAMLETGVAIPSMCLSAHRRFPFGSRDEAVRERAREIMSKAIRLARDLGIRTIQLAGYDVYYEEHDAGTQQRFAEGLAQKAVLTPPEKSLAVAAMQALDACSPVEFSEGNTTRKESVLDWFKRRLQVAAPVVQFGEHAPGSAGATVAIDAKTATDEAFDRAVRAHMRAHAITSYAEAAQAVAAGSFTA